MDSNPQSTDPKSDPYPLGHLANLGCSKPATQGRKSGAGHREEIVVRVVEYTGVRRSQR